MVSSMGRGLTIVSVVLMAGILGGATRSAVLEKIVLNYDTPVDAGLQAKLEGLDGRLREKFEMTVEQTAAGVMDLKTGRLALVRPDREEYAASVAKIGILLA